MDGAGVGRAAQHRRVHVEAQTRNLRRVAPAPEFVHFPAVGHSEHTHNGAFNARRRQQSTVLRDRDPL
uniref:H.polymorpha DL1 DNA for region containing 9 open reading frames n=1 Tax=Pichia angusta TaxID=870730 RepID=Q04334_PICAN|nr:unnamed protein product [Ogataea angusta]